MILCAIMAALILVSGIILLLGLVGGIYPSVLLPKNPGGLIASVFSPGSPLFFIFIFASVLILVWILASMLIKAFFASGLIGMAKEVIAGGKTDFDSIIAYGKRKYMDVFFAELILDAIMILPVMAFFISFVFLAAGNINIGLPSWIIIVLFLMALFISFLWTVAVSIVFSTTNFAIVISDTGSIEGIKTAYRFFTDHKSDVFLMWLATVAVSVVTFTLYFGLKMILNFIPFFGYLAEFILDISYSLFSVTVIPPLVALWWGILYIDRKKR